MNNVDNSDLYLDSFDTGGNETKCDKGMSPYKVKSKRCLTTHCARSNKKRLVNGKCPVSSKRSKSRSKKTRKKSKSRKTKKLNLKTIGIPIKRRKKRKTT